MAGDINQAVEAGNTSENSYSRLFTLIGDFSTSQNKKRFMSGTDSEEYNEEWIAIMHNLKQLYESEQQKLAHNTKASS